ncbi:hypothetical protein OG799_06530 [Micromonospora sp. NBC_00898]|uniref:hypothetical protein n=1 Tax=Micromonospora sp. NBC_00898 TaxID=2975981 RepID=UPI00386FC90B|nr:hypothetical protein OG799_06530 [Micromonospora sp. NBC_00898]
MGSTRTPLLGIAVAVGLALAGLGAPSAPAPAGVAAPAPVRGSDGAYVTQKTSVAPRQVDLTGQSPAVGRTANVRLLTPDGWEQRRPGDHRPVLCLLHGCCDSSAVFRRRNHTKTRSRRASPREPADWMA